MHEACPICGGTTRLFDRGTVAPDIYFSSTTSYTIADGADAARLPIYACLSCGHGFTPITNSHSISEWYEKAQPDSVFLSNEAARRKTARRVLETIERMVEPTSLLDVGAGPGLFVSEAVKRSWRATGLEVSSWAVDHARKTYSVPMLQGDGEALGDVVYDVVTLFDVIEHVSNPTEFLNGIAPHVASGGMIVITTPRFDSVVAKAMGKRWHCIFPAHIQYFTFPSLERSLHAAGFEIITTRSHTRYVSLKYLIYRLQNLFWKRPYSESSMFLQAAMVPMNVGDEFEVYARKL